MADSRAMVRKMKIRLDHYGELERKYQKNYGDMSKGHGSQFKVALTSQIWQNLNIKMNNKRNDT